MTAAAVRRLTPTTQSPIHPAWSADSRAIFYCTDDDLDPPRKNAAEIYRIDVASGTITTVISGGVNTYPVPSPDGAQDRLSKDPRHQQRSLCRQRRWQNGLKNLTDHPAFEGWPAWSPDGRRIAFAANRNSNYQIFVMDADGNNVQLVANTEGRATAPKWAPDGKTIYFTNCWKTGLSAACEICRRRCTLYRGRLLA